MPVLFSQLKLPTAAVALALIAAACGSGEAAPTAGAIEASQEAAPLQADAESDESTSQQTDAAASDEGQTITVTVENVAAFPIGDSGVFNTPDGASEPGPAGPGSGYTFRVTAAPGQRLSFATMLVQSNDWFLAPQPEGIALYDEGGTPISGDVTDQIYVFDSGTEIDQPFGEGADQAPRQSGPDTGDVDPDPTVRQLDRQARDYAGVVVEPLGDGEFEIRIANDSQMAIVPSPLAPGVYAAHGDDVTLFDVGSPDGGDGLEALAEDGDASALGDYLRTLTGTTTPLSPGAYAAHEETVAFFQLGEPDAGLGLEGIAEDGDPAALADTLGTVEGVSDSGAFNTPVGAGEPGPLLPGETYTFDLSVGEAGRFSFATMFVQSNDWIIATPPAGLDLATLDGDISDQLLVVDVGTEADQTPGIGPDQAPRQGGPDTGADDPDTAVRVVEDRSAERYVRVTVERS